MKDLFAHMGMSLQIGMYLGTHDGMRRVLFRQIRRRFGAVPSKIRRQIEETIEPEELDRIADVVLEVKNLKQLRQVIDPDGILVLEEHNYNSLKKKGAAKAAHGVSR